MNDVNNSSVIYRTSSKVFFCVSCKIVKTGHVTFMLETVDMCDVRVQLCASDRDSECLNSRS